MVDAAIVAIVALISLFRPDRDWACAKFATSEFVDTPLAVAEAPNVKGLYRRARGELLPRFTDIDSAYETPINPEIRIDTLQLSANDAARQIAQFWDASSA